MRLGERRLLTASGGAALTTTVSVTQFLPNTQFIEMAPRNFSTAVVVKYQLNPYLYVFRTVDSLASPPFDYSEAAQDGSASVDVVLSSLSTVANGDWVLLGSHLPFRGVQVDVDGTNSTASVTATLSYWNGGAWVDLSATDGTSSSTHLDQDGAITWTVPSAWKLETLKTIADATGLSITSEDFPGKNEFLYWVRWEVDDALDSSTTANSICALNRSTSYAEILPGWVIEEEITRGPGGLGCIEHLTNAGTANLVVNGYILEGGRFA